MTADTDHQHSVLLAEHFVIQVDADDRVGAEFGGSGNYLGHGGFSRCAEFLFVGSGTAADDVANSGEEVAEYIRAENSLSGNDAAVVANPFAFDAGCRGDSHCDCL